jgi:hypothetical protein
VASDSLGRLTVVCASQEKECPIQAIQGKHVFITENDSARRSSIAVETIDLQGRLADIEAQQKQAV